MEVLEGGKKDVTIIKVKQLLDPDFAASLAKFVKLTPPDGKLIFKIKKMNKKFKDALKIYNEARIELAKSCAKLDAKTGEPEVSYDFNGEEKVILDSAKQSEFGKKLKDLMDVEIEVADKFKYEADLGGKASGLNGDDVTNLEFILED